MFSKRKILRAALAVFCMVSMLIISNYDVQKVYAGTGYEFVILGTYSETMSIGDSFYLPAITSTGKKPSFSSSNSKIASVNTYGKVTAKKAGKVRITAKIKNGEASCTVVVKKTDIELNKERLSLENGFRVKLTATVSTGHTVTWKSSKSSIASVDDRGNVLAKKPGSTTITASADGTSVSCQVTVKKPSLKLNKNKISMYRKDKVRLTLTSTSKSAPKWKSNKKSVATVDSNGVVTAVKNGTAVITVTVDGVSKTCEVTVKKPDISFEAESITMAKGGREKLKVTVSSGNRPTFSSSNLNIVTVDEYGTIHAKGVGKAYIYASEDGAKVRITVYVK